MPDVNELPCTSTPAALGQVRSAQELTHNAGNAATGGVWRVEGSTMSAVLKVARPPSESLVGSPAWQTSADPSHWNFWRREIDAYTSGMTGAYADAGIVAPELLEVVERADGGVELWLAYTAGMPGKSWPVPRLAHFAYQLGVAQARWCGRLPEPAWLSRGWLEQYVGNGPASLQQPDSAVWEHPLAAVWPAEDRAVLRRVWTERQRLVVAAGAAPRTLCHLDVWPNNLIHADAAVAGAAGTIGTSTLLDWAFLGEGGLGEDVANLIVDSVADGWMPTSLLPEIDFSCTERYIDGLRDGGWVGSPDAIRMAIAWAGVAKYCWFSPAALTRAIRGSYGAAGYGRDRDPNDALARLSTLISHLAGWARSVGV